MMLMRSDDRDDRAVGTYSEPMLASVLLDRDTKVRLPVVTRPLNPSADLDAIGAYVEGLWSGSASAEDLADLVERTSCIEHIESFAALVPHANIDHLKGVVAMIQVMDT
jgi:hypothetical protein